MNSTTQQMKTMNFSKIQFVDSKSATTESAAVENLDSFSIVAEEPTQPNSKMVSPAQMRTSVIRRVHIRHNSGFDRQLDQVQHAVLRAPDSMGNESRTSSLLDRCK